VKPNSSFSILTGWNLVVSSTEAFARWELWLELLSDGDTLYPLITFSALTHIDISTPSPLRKAFPPILGIQSVFRRSQLQNHHIEMERLSRKPITENQERMKRNQTRPITMRTPRSAGLSRKVWDVREDTDMANFQGEHLNNGFK